MTQKIKLENILKSFLAQILLLKAPRTNRRNLQFTDIKLNLVTGKAGQRWAQSGRALTGSQSERAPNSGAVHNYLLGLDCSRTLTKMCYETCVDVVAKACIYFAADM